MSAINTERRAPLRGATTDRLHQLLREVAFGEQMMAALMAEMPKALCEGRMDAWAACGHAWIDLIAITAKRRVRE